MCFATSRVFVHRAVYDDVVARIGSIATTMQMGSGLNPDTQLGMMRQTPCNARTTLTTGSPRACGPVIYRVPIDSALSSKLALSGSTATSFSTNRCPLPAGRRPDSAWKAVRAGSANT
jgi:hypothetical protein